VETLLALDIPVSLSLRARGLHIAAFEAPTEAEVRRRFEEAMGIYRQVGNRSALLRVLLEASAGPSAGIDASWREGLAREALTLARELGARGATGISLRGLGFSAQHKGNLDQARALFEESLAVERARGHRLGMAWSWHALAWLALLEGDVVRARELAATCEPFYRAADAFLDLANLQALVAIAEFLQEDYQALYTRFHQSAREPRLSSADRYSSQWLYLLAAARAAEGAAEDAARFMGAAEAAGYQVETTGLTEFRDVFAARIAPARARVDGASGTWQAAWEEGRAMTLQEAIAYALSSVPGAELPQSSDAWQS
jgi:hypothetical protein